MLDISAFFVYDTLLLRLSFAEIISGRTSTTRLIKPFEANYFDYLYKEGGQNCSSQTEGKQVRSGMIGREVRKTKMAKPGNKGSVATSSTDSHWNSGTVGDRAVWALVEQGAHAAGFSIAKNDGIRKAVLSVIGKGGVTSALGTAGLLAGIAALTDLEIPARFLAKKFGLPESATAELANQGLDDVVRGVFDGAQSIDPKAPLDQQNKELKELADKKWGEHAEKIRKNNPHLFREVILAREYDVLTIHELGCKFLRPLLDANAVGVSRVNALAVPVGTLPAACVCQKGIVGTLNHVLEVLRKQGKGALASEVRDEIQKPEYADDAAEFIGRMGTYDQVSIESVHAAAKATGPLRRVYFLAIVGMKPKAGVEAAGDEIKKKGKQIFKDLMNPDSELRQHLEVKTTEWSGDAARRSAAANRKV